MTQRELYYRLKGLDDVGPSWTVRQVNEAVQVCCSCLIVGMVALSSDSTVMQYMCSLLAAV